MRAFNSRVQFRCLNGCTCKRSLISQSGFETGSLSSYILLQSSLLFPAEGFQRSIVEGGVKRQARCMQLLNDSNVQLLLCNQDFDIAAPQRSGQTRVEQRLGQDAASHGEAFYSAFTGAVTGLNACRDAQFSVRQGDGTKDQPFSGSLLKP